MQYASAFEIITKYGSEIAGADKEQTKAIPRVDPQPGKNKSGWLKMAFGQTCSKNHKQSDAFDLESQNRKFRQDNNVHTPN